MAIELIPVPPIRDASKPQDVRRLVDHLNAVQAQIGRLSDNADAPDTPTSIVVRQGAGKTVEIVATFAEPPFPWTAELWRNTSNSVATATKLDAKTSHSFHDVSVSYGSTYYYWVRTVGLNGVNTSGWSPSSGHSITVSQIVTADIGGGQVTTPEIGASAVTQSATASAANLVSTTSGTAADMPNMSVTLTFTGGPVLIVFDADVELVNTSGATATLQMKYHLQRDGSDVNVGRFQASAVPNNDYDTTNAGFSHYETPSAGSHTYKIQWHMNPAGAGHTTKALERRLTVVEFKR